MDSALDPTDLRGAVVVAVDGSEDAERARRWAVDQASLEHRRLVVVSAGDRSDALVKEAVAAAQQLAHDLPVIAVAASGDPRQVLIDASAHAHLVVLGSRGRGSVRTMLLGSVSATVSAHAACPVIVCRPTDPDRVRRGVVVGADATPESRPVLEFAYRQASLRGLPLTVLHTYWDAAAAVAQHYQVSGAKAERPDLEDLRAILSESVAGLAETYPDVRAHITLQHGLADETLGTREDGWDLVVVGRHSMSTLERFLTGSIASAVVERAHATVAVVPVGPRSS